jgi:Zn-finger protein
MPLLIETENLLEIWQSMHFKKIAGELRAAGIKIDEPHIPEIIRQTSFDVRSKKYLDECPYYQPQEPCHDIKDLNCLLCACPNYVFDRLEGGCKLEGNKGCWQYHSNLPMGKVWDCSNCAVGHTPEETKAWLKNNIDWLARQ